MRNVLMRQQQRFFNQLIAVYQISFLFDALDQSIHLRIGVTTNVVIAITTGSHAAHQRLKTVQSVKGWHAPAEHVDTGLVALNHREVGDQRQGTQLSFHANF